MKSADIEPVIVEQLFDAPMERVWDAITKVDQMHQWYFPNIPAFEPMEGFETAFDVYSGPRLFRHLWKITAVKPGQMIRYTWKYPGFTGEGIVTFELSEAKGKTQLRVTNEGLDTFPDDIPEFTRESCELGWRYLVGERLKEFLK